MLCESGGDPSASNPSGASGLFQVMPSWADEYAAVTGVPYYDGRFDPGANIRFAAWLQAEGGWGHWVCY
jgi:soluble lytic murein transglycosylase-like protein